MKFIHFMTLMFAMVLLTSCATINKGLKSLVGRSDPPPAEKTKAKASRFSDDSSLPVVNSRRNWQRMTREQFEQDAQVDGAPGSLWVMEGQSSYMFSSNVLRLPGEVVNVKMEGAPKSQLETKVKVIQQMLARLDKPKRKPAAVPQAKAGEPQPAQAPQPEAPAAPEPPTAASKEENEAKLLVDLVPARIVDRTADGNYRIKGSQNFMIGKREYRVIVTGLVKPADVNGDEVRADQVLDPKFDIVTLKKELKL